MWRQAYRRTGGVRGSRGPGTVGRGAGQHFPVHRISMFVHNSRWLLIGLVPAPRGKVPC
jgi:hypothetical protein